MFAQAVNKDSQRLRFPNLETVVWSLLHRDHQVLNLFVVDLAHHCNYFVMFVFVCVCTDPLEDFVTGQRNNTFVLTIANHGVTFTGTCLAIGEEAGVISLPSVVKHTDSNLLKNILLVFVK
jgi:hypothetical protein